VPVEPRLLTARLRSRPIARPAPTERHRAPIEQEIAHYVFTHGFVDAMKPTLILPIAVLVLAAFATAFVRAHRQASVLQAPEEAVAVA
jgi:hypothetical protein